MENDVVEVISKDKALDDKGDTKEEVQYEPIPNYVLSLYDRVTKLEDSQKDFTNIATDIYKNKKEEQKLTLRNIYAHGAYIFVILWSIYFMVILCFNATEFLGFHLSDKVIIALITGVTVNLIAILIVVMKNLFPHTTKK